MAIEPQELRRIVGQFVTSVTVITTMDQQSTLNGLTANPFMSPLLDPPPVLIRVDKRASSKDT